MRVKKEMDKFPENVTLHQQLKYHEKWLLDLGEGKLPTYLTNIVEIPSSMYVKSKEDVIDVLFGDLEENVGNEEYFKTRGILAATNDVVTETNDKLVEHLPG
ncbi:hypothetical protein ACHAWF_014415 [Thalassiosira exigua]